MGILISPNKRLFLENLLSPCKISIFIEVWLSYIVYNRSVLLTGTTVFLSIIGQKCPSS